MTKEIAAILAVGPYGVIGKGDKLVWHSKADFKHFKAKTMNWPCIFGATTFYGLPNYPLKNRLNIVLNKPQKEDTLVDPRGWLTFNDITKAYEYCENYDNVFVCGGKSIYEYVIKNNLVNTIYLTEVKSDKLEEEIHNNIDDYVRLNIDFNLFEHGGWVCSSFEYPSEEDMKDDDVKVKFIKYIRINEV
ncbi:MAG: dihydrofolate reductase [Bacilli bacterium]|nr:dihydrofolate reductase [Clostridia bacterium]MBR4618093.1 dihydrofolate reductase [Bacilli bacterium]